MNDDGTRYKNYSKELSYLIQFDIEHILIENPSGEEFRSEDYIDGTASTYHDLVSSMKELAKKNGINESEIALDILSKEDVSSIPFKFRKLQKKK